MRLPARFLGVALLALLAVAGWRVTTGRGGDPPPGSEVQPVAQGGLVYTLTAEPPAVRAGEDLKLRLDILNRDGKAVVLEFAGDLEYDFTVTRDGAVVWQWSRGRVPETREHSRVLAAGASLDYAAIWDGRDDRGNLLAPGRYEVRAVFLGEPDGVRFIGPVTVELL